VNPGGTFAFIDYFYDENYYEEIGARKILKRLESGAV